MTPAGNSIAEPTARPSLRWLKRALQAIVLVAAVLYLVRLARSHSAEFSDLRLTIRLTPLLAASVLTFAGYLVNVAVWVASLRWWNQHIRFRAATRIWFVSNLARFIPGVVWQFAGLAGMSYEAGVSPVAATGAILLQQVGLLCTGLVVALMLSPAFIPAWTARLDPASAAGQFGMSIATDVQQLPLATRVLVGGLVAVAVVALLPVAVRLAARTWNRMSGRSTAMPTLHWRRAAAYLGALAVPWLLYGAAFWLFGIALLGDHAPTIAVATAAFVTSYVAGIIVVIAPAGLGVREVVLYAALTPVIGARNAFILSVLSRVWLIAVEILSALVVLALPRPARPD